MKLAIVVGHSNDNKGAYGVLPLNKYEYEYNREIASLMFRFAMEIGMQTRIFTRDGVGIKGCYEQVNAWIGKDRGAVIELHFNSHKNNKAHGTETLFDNEPLESVELAHEVHEAVIAVFSRHGPADRGKKLIDLTDENYERGEINFKECKSAMVLVEPGFGSNREDAALLRERKIEYAACLVAAVDKYFKNQIRMMELH